MGQVPEIKLMMMIMMIMIMIMNFLYEYLAMCHRLMHGKFQRSSAKKTFLISELRMERVGKCAFFNRKLAIFRKRLEIRPKLLLITNKKWHTSFQIK